MTIRLYRTNVLFVQINRCPILKFLGCFLRGLASFQECLRLFFPHCDNRSVYLDEPLNPWNRVHDGLVIRIRNGRRRISPSGPASLIFPLSNIIFDSSTCLAVISLITEKPIMPGVPCLSAKSKYFMNAQASCFAPEFAFNPSMSSLPNVIPLASPPDRVWNTSLLTWNIISGNMIISIGIIKSYGRTFAGLAPAFPR